MIILIDSREQLALEFPKAKETRNVCLKVGDYSACFYEDHQISIVFERKSIADLYGTLSAGYERFRREIDRAKKNNIRLIIIVEGTLSKVLKGYCHSSRNAISIVYQLFTLRARHNIETVFCKDREEMSEYISQFYIAHFKEWQDKQKASK